MKKKFVITMLGASALFFSSVAEAGFYGAPAPEPFVRPYSRPVRVSDNFVRVAGGADIPFSGDAIAGGKGQCKTCCNTCATIDVNGVDVRDAWKNFTGGSVEIGYKARSNLDISIGLEYLRGKGSGFTMGKFYDSEKIHGDITDYKEYSVFLRAVQHYLNGNRWHPYFFGQIGVGMVKDIDVNFWTNNGSLNPGWMHLYDETIVFKGAIGIGFTYQLNNNFMVGAEIGLGYRTGLNGADDHLSDFDLGEINDTDGMIFLPARVFGAYYF